MRLYTRNGHDFGKHFPLVVTALAALPARSCLIDGEAIVSEDSGLAVFELIRSWRHDADAVLCAFDLLELDGEDLHQLPIEQRKRTLTKLVCAPRPGISATVVSSTSRPANSVAGAPFSKRLGSTYRSGRSRHWIKVKNPAAAAVRREDEEEWGSDGAGRLLGMVDVRPAACLLPWLLIAFAGRAGRYPPAAV